MVVAIPLSDMEIKKQLPNDWDSAETMGGDQPGKKTNLSRFLALFLLLLCSISFYACSSDSMSAIGRWRDLVTAWPYKGNAGEDMIYDFNDVRAVIFYCTICPSLPVLVTVLFLSHA